VFWLNDLHSQSRSKKFFAFFFFLFKITFFKEISSPQVSALRKKLGLHATGGDVPKPCVSFVHFGFDDMMMALIRKLEYTSPTPIQAQAVPCALAGRDVIGMYLRMLRLCAIICISIALMSILLVKLAC
jgi:hypothetical protein